MLLPFNFISTISSNDEIEQIKKDLPKMLGANNVGTDFYLTFQPCWETEGARNDLRIYISSSVETNVTLEIEGKSIKKTKKTIPNDIIEFKLNPAEGQCYQKDDVTPPETERVYPGYAIHIYSDDPIICYGVTRYQYTSDGFLALPVNSFGNEYIIASYADPTPNVTQWLQLYKCCLLDSTIVRFTLGGTKQLEKG